MIAFNSTYKSYRLLCAYENISIVYAQYKFYIYYYYYLLVSRSTSRLVVLLVC